MKSSRAQILAKYNAVLHLQFTARRFTSFAGLAVFQLLFARLSLKQRLQACLAHLPGAPIFPRHLVLLLLVVHLLLGFRRLREVAYYRDDPLVQRLLGLRRLPDVSTISRTLAALDELSLDNLRGCSTELVLQRLRRERFSALTCDFDGTVLSTKGHAQGTAVGYNPRHKGHRSYYPLFCTVAETGQFFDLHHRPGNVHDSHEALELFDLCLGQLRAEFPRLKLRARADGAFFSREIIELCEDYGAGFSIGVPFARLWDLKRLVERQRRWRRIDGEWSYAELSYRPKSWPKAYRFLLLRRKVKRQDKGPLQLELFTPQSRGYEHTVIVTNLQLAARAVMQFHHGRGAQEALFGEAKQHAGLALLPSKRLHGNQAFTLCSMLAHNLGRELQMVARPRRREPNRKATAAWRFQCLGTLRRLWLCRAALISRPQGRLTLCLADNHAVKRDLTHYFDKLQSAA